MLSPLRFFPVLMLVFGLVAAGHAAEKGGYQYEIQKVTIDRADTRGVDLNVSRLDRFMGLKAMLRNTSVREVPASEITWEFITRRTSGALEHSTGKEKLPALRAGEKTELILGLVNIQGVRNGAITTKDEFDWQITITREGKETFSVNSTKSFDSLAKRAVKVEAPKSDPPAAAEPAKVEAPKP